MSDKKLWEQYVALEKERDALRAKIEQMERQEPVAWWGRGPRDGRIEFSAHKPAPSVMRDFAVTPLYALPGAQPAPSVPDGFAWPECPKRRQSHVLFDDGYEEGWAACVATIKAALAAPEAKP